MPHSFEHSTFAPDLDSPAELAATTRTVATGWGVPARPAARLTARVHTLAMLLTACSASEFHLHLFHEEGHVRAQIATPTTVLSHRLAAWQAHPAQTHARYTTGVDTQEQPYSHGVPVIEHSRHPTPLRVR